MAVESTTTELQRRLSELKQWLPDDSFISEIDQITQLILHIANDRADAREMLDQEKLKNFHLERKLSTIGITACDLMAPAWVRMDAIKVILES